MHVWQCICQCLSFSAPPCDEHDRGLNLLPAVLCQPDLRCTCGVGTGGRPPLMLAGSMTIAFDSSKPSGRRVHFCTAQAFNSGHTPGQLQTWKHVNKLVVRLDAASMIFSKIFFFYSPLGSSAETQLCR